MTQSDYSRMIAHLNGAFYGLFMVLACFFMYDCSTSTRLSELGLASIAPDNLRTAPESFQLHLQVEQRDFPVEAMMQSDSWKRLNASLNAYADRLEMMTQQNLTRKWAVMGLYLASAIGMATCGFLSRRGLGKIEKDSNTNSTQAAASVPAIE